ncbi:hypothetical protein J2Z23_001371 [Lederbergia galactosidilyticus]|uniref:ROK family transcriptional regulator n=1 Tax=Lederbergia galactosidilytica TaxID=217031 RepID=UPI001AE473E0|nr:ROK family transcriptional regulator [Lederbergia galactosidilytica]MBP1914426.1 hypothetical protein [Lederbergia galactosidilytica]
MNLNPKPMRVTIIHAIRKTLLELGSATKVELSEKLGFSFPTISKLLAEMEEKNELSLVGLDDSSGGRRAKRYAYNSEYMLGLAIFLERTETKYIVFNCLGEVRDSGKTSSVLVDLELEILANYIQGIIGKHPSISAIAIGVPGSVDNGHIFYIPGYEQLQNVDLKGYLEDQLTIPVVIENDMNAAVRGYHDRHRIKSHNSLVYLYSGQNGPGAGIMINGDIVRGSTHFSGEISFIPQYDDRNFGEVLKNGRGFNKRLIRSDEEIDAISRLIVSFTAILNPHTFIFCNDEVEEPTLKKIAQLCAKYIPREHLPELTTSDWKQDYLSGLQSLGLDRMMDVITK